MNHDKGISLLWQWLDHYACRGGTEPSTNALVALTHAFRCFWLQTLKLDCGLVELFYYDFQNSKLQVKVDNM